MLISMGRSGNSVCVGAVKTASESNNHLLIASLITVAVMPFRHEEDKYTSNTNTVCSLIITERTEVNRIHVSFQMAAR
jgi:hypothetical protein